MWDFLLYHTPVFYLHQSVWRDEAFSILLAQKPLITFITSTSLDPPFYYVLLHIWMKIFGAGETAVRSLSLVGFLLTVLLLAHWAKKLFNSHWLSWYVPIFFFLNPHLLYYAFEARAYAWYAFFTVASLYAYVEKKYYVYILATVLGIYTHTYMVFVLLAQITHYFLTKRYHRLMSHSFIATGILSSFWLYKVIADLAKLRESWYFPINAQLVYSVLGNIFIGYDGTPGYLWQSTTIISIIIFIFSLIVFKSRKNKSLNLLFILLLFQPLLLVLGISFYKPIFVNRYVLPSTIAEIFLIAYAISNIQNKKIQKIIAGACILFVCIFNVWFTDKHPKVNMRATVKEINKLLKPNDIILVHSPLNLFETIYYSNDSRVYWYNPTNSVFPWYIGDLLVDPSKIISSLPPYPYRAFMVYENGDYTIMYQRSIGGKR